MTREQAVDIIKETLSKELGKVLGASGGGNSTYLQLRESREGRERQEERLREARKAEKAQRKEGKRSLKEGRRIFESMGMDKGAAKLAARGRESFHG